MVVPAPSRQRLFNLAFVDAPDETSVAWWLHDVIVSGTAPREGRLPVVVTPNVDILVRLSRNESRSADHVMSNADIVLPDGQPVVWASRLLKTPLSARISGSGVVDRLWPSLIDDCIPLAVVAPSDYIRERAQTDAPSASVVTAPLMRTVDDCVEFGRQLAQNPGIANARAVFFNLSFPKQEVVIEEFLRHIAGPRQPWCLAVGASFEMYYGLRRRAPRWMQRAGLEWFHRFLLEPRRLFRRYFIDDVAFVGVVWREHRRRR